LRTVPFGLAVASAIAALASCTTMQQYWPDAKVVVIDGQEHLVRKLPNVEDAYQAMENRPTAQSAIIGVIDPLVYARNVRAIEQATGCPVVPGSIQNSGNQTIAAAQC
jgi:hypothetical protein